LLSCFLANVVRAASSSTAASPTAQPTPSSNAEIFPGLGAYKYFGCYNETVLLNNTGNVRALSGGPTESLDDMTIATCINFCGNNSYTFAGLEYTKECYCANYISTFSTHLPDSDCNLPCAGNTTQICGGSLRLSVYQKQTSNKGAGTKVKEAPLSSVLALGIAIGFL
ncbi:WSC domain-containing protein, partial [Xylogone sp. PMI_703]